MIEPITTIASLIHLANLLWRIFKKIKTWLKSRDPQYKETNRFMKLLHDYVENNRHRPNMRVDNIYRQMAEIVDKRKNNTWVSAPSYDDAEVSAEEREEYDSDDHVTDFEASDDENGYNDEDEEGFE